MREDRWSDNKVGLRLLRQKLANLGICRCLLSVRMCWIYRAGSRISQRSGRYQHRCRRNTRGPYLAAKRSNTELPRRLLLSAVCNRERLRLPPSGLLLAPIRDGVNWPRGIGLMDLVRESTSTLRTSSTSPLEKTFSPDPYGPGVKEEDPNDFVTGHADE
jgi:hypothetical protein